MSNPEANGPPTPDNPDNPELPERSIEGRPKSVEAAEKSLVGTPEAEREKPRIGDTRPAPPPSNTDAQAGGDKAKADGESGPKKRRRRGNRGRGSNKSGGGQGRGDQQNSDKENSGNRAKGGGQGNRQGGRNKEPASPVVAMNDDDPVELDEETLAKRKGRRRNGKPVGRYSMIVHVEDNATQVAVIEGRQLIEHYVSRPSDDTFQIHGNVYLGRVQNVLPGMEAAFVDIATPKNAVLYRGDVQYDKEDLLDGSGGQHKGGKGQKKGGKGGGNKGDEPRIEQLLKARQAILCQVTKNPIAHKGARLTQEVSLPGRFCVLVPNSSTYGISKRLPDKERKRLRAVLDKVKPAEHGIIVRTAAENVTEEEIARDVVRLLDQWKQIEKLANSSKAPALLYREPDLAIRFIREEFNKNYRQVVIDDHALYEEMKSYVASVAPALAERIVYYDTAAESLPVFERHHVAEQLLKALDRKVWLPSGGSLIIEHTEALTVIDVNTGKNVGSKSLEETVFHNNLEAAEEIARQLRLRDIGGIIVIDFVDMEIKKNREKVSQGFREALARDKTRTQIFDISELGLVEMTRKRIGEGLLESMTHSCETCEGRGHVIEHELLEL